MKTNDRTRAKIDTERQARGGAARKDMPEQQRPQPRGPDARPDEPRHPQPAPPRQPDRADQPSARQDQGGGSRVGGPRERSDEETIGRPVQLDEAPDTEERPDPPTRTEPQRERTGAR